MKRKIRLMMISACMAAAVTWCAGTALASEVNWGDLIEDLAEDNLEGEFVIINELGLKMWIPEDMKEETVDEDMKDAGYLRYYTSSNQKAKGTNDKPTVAVTYVDMDGLGLPAYEKLVETSGGSGLTELNLNGLGAITYDLEEADLTAIAFVTERGYIVEFLFYPMSDEAFAKEVEYMTASIMSAEEN